MRKNDLTKNRTAKTAKKSTAKTAKKSRALSARKHHAAIDAAILAEDLKEAMLERDQAEADRDHEFSRAEKWEASAMSQRRAEQSFFEKVQVELGLTPLSPENLTNGATVEEIFLKLRSFKSGALPPHDVQSQTAVASLVNDARRALNLTSSEGLVEGILRLQETLKRSKSELDLLRNNERDRLRTVVVPEKVKCPDRKLLTVNGLGYRFDCRLEYGHVHAHAWDSLGTCFLERNSYYCRYEAWYPGRGAFYPRLEGNLDALLPCGLPRWGRGSWLLRGPLRS